MNLNVGSGQFPAAGWTNLDLDPAVRPDVIGDLRDLPAEIIEVKTVYLGHVLHDIPPAQVPVALAQLWQRCASGARVCAVEPDLVRAWDQIMNQTMDEDTARRFRAGSGWKWAPSEQRLLDLMRVSGLLWCAPTPIGSNQLDEFPVVSRVGWQCAVVGAVR